MKYSIIVKSLIFCLLTLPLASLEVRTEQHKSINGSEKIYYPDFARRFSDTLKTHPPVHDCTVHLLTKEGQNSIERLHIAIQIDRQALVTYLQGRSNRLFISLKDQEHYLTDFSYTIRQTAKEIFTEVSHEAIKVELSFAE